MAQANRAPKQWQLEKKETLNSFNAWKENLTFVLSLNDNFAPFMTATWGAWSEDNLYRGFTDDAADVAADQRKTRQQKVTQLGLMLGQVANYATVISRFQITQESTSLKSVWAKIREHYGFHSTGSKFIDLVNIRLETNERHEDLYQRLFSFVYDNLLTTDGGIRHRGAVVTRNEQITPTIENMVVLTWLERIHSGLPALVRQKYGSELRNQTLASLKSEISQSIDSLLEELKSSEDSRVMRLHQNNNNWNNNGGNNRKPARGNQKTRFCCLCDASKRPSDHFLSQCKFLPEADRRRMTNSRVRIVGVDDHDSEDDDTEERDDDDTSGNSIFIDQQPSSVRRVVTRRSPCLNCFVGQLAVRVCLDSGAESSMISERIARQINLDVGPATQGAVQADEISPLRVIGEVKNVKLTYGPHTFRFDGLVTSTNCGDVIGGEPFLEANDIALRSAKRQIIIRGRDIVPY